eukprot:SAG22_NODE_10649_length_523_cov_0.955189_1_plen_108_part_10
MGEFFTWLRSTDVLAMQLRTRMNLGGGMTAMRDKKTSIDYKMLSSSDLVGPSVRKALRLLLHTLCFFVCCAFHPSTAAYRQFVPNIVLLLPCCSCFVLCCVVLCCVVF